MRPARFQDFAVETLLKAPEIKNAEPWTEPDRTFGIHLTFNTGAQLWAAITATAAPGDDYDRPEIPVAYEPPAEVAWPDPYEGGKVTPPRAEAFLAAAFTNSGSGEIARAYEYSAGATPTRPTAHPGMGIVFHDESRIQVLFQHTARAGQDKGGRSFDLQDAF
ncbi:hypothetical protein ABT115_15260 [Streptomyces sp. NPDC001832]|uniref:hypothetical protein n=1 Tax=Streptomyces sp. NPDC001832 TaxID=3154527 RepID=UPI003326D71D